MKMKNAQKRRKRKRTPKPVGRPTVYRIYMAEQARKLCELGYTDKELADFFGISEQSLCVWKRKHPQFVGSIRNGKAIVDAQVADSLCHQAVGYSHKAVKIMQAQGTVYAHEYMEHYPPDTTAAIFWLKNRQRAKWRNTTKT
jgi:hypothetical protein